LLCLRTRLRDQLKLATTVGYGPRYLHSTGQFHKGDGNQGLFIQLTADDRQDTPIPDDMGPSGSWITFGILKTAQALGTGRRSSMPAVPSSASISEGMSSVV